MEPNLDANDFRYSINLCQKVPRSVEVVLPDVLAYLVFSQVLSYSVCVYLVYSGIGGFVISTSRDPTLQVQKVCKWYKVRRN